MALRIVDNPYCVVKIDVNDVKIEDSIHTQNLKFSTLMINWRERFMIAKFPMNANYQNGHWI